MIFKQKNNITEQLLIRSAKCAGLFVVFCLVFSIFSYAAFAFQSSQAKTLRAEFMKPDEPDSNNDGVPDWWYAKYLAMLDDKDKEYMFNPKFPDSGSYDADNDGFSNLDEYRMKTDPLKDEQMIKVDVEASPAKGSAPLEVLFTVSIDENDNIVKYEVDFDGNGTYDMWQYLPDNAGNKFEFTHTYTTSYCEYNPRVRVTDSMGFVRVGYPNSGIEVLPSTDSPEVNVELIGKDIAVPYEVLLKGSVTDVKNAARYQWDTDGDGEYDYSSSQSNSVSVSYNETYSKSVNTYLKVTNNNGFSDQAQLRLNLNADKWYDTDLWVYRPKVLLTDYSIIAYAGEEVELEGSGAPMGYLTYGQDRYGYIKKLEWDFESDGNYDYVVELNNTTWKYGTAKVKHNYGVPGIYKATLKVTDDTGKTAADHCIIRIIDKGFHPYAKAVVSYKDVSGATAIENGKLPLSVTFDHSLSSGDIVKYEWDFNDDKYIDFITTSNDARPVYHYKYPGFYRAELIVTDIYGLKDSFYVPIFVSCPNAVDGYSSYISVPFNGAKVAGNYLTLCSYIYPDNVNAENVVFQYKKKEESSWNNIQKTVKYLDFYKVNWDTTVLIDNVEYEIRAIVNGAQENKYEKISVIISNLNRSDADIVENYEGTFFKSMKLDISQSSSIIIPYGAQIDIPLGAVNPEDSSATITITERTDVKADVGRVIDIKGIKEFSKDITITIPYLDADNNSIVDGTNIDETTLKVQWLNEDKNAWEPIYNSTVYFGENFVSAKVNHLSSFGLFSMAAKFFTGISTASEAGGGGSVSYCFIATAAYGTPMAEDVMILRRFRDNVLLKNEFGRAFVRFYYTHGPNAASFIREKPVLRKVVRALLKPFVAIARNFGKGGI